MFDLDEAIKEVLEKSEYQIEQETAYKWASRASACFKLSESSINMGEKISWLVRGFGDKIESTEHSSQCKDDGNTLKEVTEIIESYEELAINSLSSFLKV
jgi:hypothetical protein